MKPFAEVHWEKEDLERALRVACVPDTKDNAKKLRELLDTDRLEEAMIEAGWDFIHATVSQLINDGTFTQDDEMKYYDPDFPIYAEQGDYPITQRRI